MSGRGRSSGVVSIGGWCHSIDRGEGGAGNGGRLFPTKVAEVHQCSGCLWSVSSCLDSLFVGVVRSADCRAPLKDGVYLFLHEDSHLQCAKCGLLLTP